MYTGMHHLIIVHVHVPPLQSTFTTVHVFFSKIKTHIPFWDQTMLYSKYPDRHMLWWLTILSNHSFHGHSSDWGGSPWQYYIITSLMCHELDYTGRPKKNATLIYLYVGLLEVTCSWISLVLGVKFKVLNMLFQQCNISIWALIFKW